MTHATGDPTITAMPRTELALFTEAFARVLTPFCGRLTEARRALAELELAGLTEPRGELAELARELDGLVRRVGEERATLFLFGPRKGGKSTLASALAGEVLDSVSGFPGYPCVQELASGPPTLELACFDGSVERCADAGGLELALARCLSELSEAVRDAAARGETFEPARDLPQAVRRVTRARPLRALADAALGLVECPSLGAPLFGAHETMLVGAPDGARAAVLVLRPLQLADDASFAGLAELLQAFPEVFLVLNVDGRAQELDLSGQWVGALEREDPWRLLDAFRAATGSVALYDAWRAGRLRVLAVDLLEGLRARLRGEEERAPGRRARLSDLERELCAALDRHGARASFVASAVRRARELAGELAGLDAWPAFAPLGPALAALRAERQAAERRLGAFAALDERPASLWGGEPVFVRLRQELARAAAQRVDARLGELAGPFRTALEDWFASDESLQELIEARLAPRLAQAARELAAAHPGELAAALAGLRSAQLFSPAVAAEFAAAGLAPRELFAFPGTFVAPVAPLPRPLDLAAIPVKKGFAQRLARTKDDDVRRAFFGPDEAPARKLTSREKGERLGRELLKTLCDEALARARSAFGEAAHLASGAALEALQAGFRSALAARLASERAALAGPLAEVRAREQALELAQAAVRALAQAELRAQGELEELLARHTGTLTPVPRRRPAEAFAPAPGELVERE